MKTPNAKSAAPAKPTAPAPPKIETVLVKPLPKEEALPASAQAVSSLAELLHGLGPRRLVADKWGCTPRTLEIRMHKPETTTLQELKDLASLAQLDLPTVFRLAYQQMEHPVVVPAAGGPGKPGRPPRR